MSWFWGSLWFWLLVPLAVYGVSAIVFAAYFRAKADYLRRYFHGTDQEKDNGNDAG